ncbi:MAG: hypothetical protein JXL85_05310 [Bacilli bacterium]|nr:hypothetical protein [Bacilli bacterium]
MLILPLGIDKANPGWTVIDSIVSMLIISIAFVGVSLLVTNLLGNARIHVEEIKNKIEYENDLVDHFLEILE